MFESRRGTKQLACLLSALLLLLQQSVCPVSANNLDLRHESALAQSVAVAGAQASAPDKDEAEQSADAGAPNVDKTLLAMRDANVRNEAGADAQIVNAPKTVAPVEIVLANGLKVIVLEDHSFPVVSCMAWYKVGSRNERAGATGVSHLVEHLLFGRVGDYRPGEIGTLIARVGGQFNGYTSDDFTTFFETVPASKLELALKIESDRMRKGAFTEADVSQEVTNIQKEFESETRDEMSLLSKEVRAALYQQHPYHNPIMGWPSDVENLTLKEAKTFYDRYFWPDNAVLVLSGDVHPKQVVPLVQRYFEFIPKNPAPPPPVPQLTEAPQKGERRVSVKHPGRREMLQVAYHAPALDDPDAPVLMVIEKLLNSHFAGRLKAKLVDAKACSFATSIFEMKKDPGLFNITCVAVPGTPNAQQKMLDALDGCLSGLRSQPISDVELRRARNQAEFSFFSERDGPYRASFHIGYFESLSKWQNAYTWTDKIKAVTVADVQRVARQYLDPETRVVGWLAGMGAPKCAPPKSVPDAAPSTSPGKGAPSKQMEHVRMTGYKESDTDASPDGKHTSEGGGGGEQSGSSGLDTAVKNIPTAIKELPRAVQQIPNAVKHIPSAIGNIPAAIKEIPSAVRNLPGAATTTIRDLPSAVGELPGAAASTLKGLPGTVYAIPGAAASAVRGLPSALGSIASEVGTNVGKQLHVGGARNDTARIERKVLRNGMTVVVCEAHLSPITHIAGAVRAGDAYDPAGKKGLSAVAAAILDRGSARRGKYQMNTLQEDLGIPPSNQLRFNSSAESITFSTRCLSRDLETNLELIAESLSAPALAEEEFAKAKAEVVCDLKQNDDSLDNKVERALLRSLLASHSAFYPDDPSDRIKSVNGLNLADLQKYFASIAVPQATTLVITGDVDCRQTIQVLEKVFDSWSPKSAGQRLQVHANPKRVLRATIPIKDTCKNAVCFGQFIPSPPASADYGSLLVADSIFANHPLFARLAQKMSVDATENHVFKPQSLGSGFSTLGQNLTWSVRATVEPNSVPLTVRTLQSELKALGKTGVSPQEFQEVKRYLVGSLAVKNMSNISSLSQTLLEGLARGEESNPLYGVLNAVRGTTLESVNHTIKNILKPDRATLVIAATPQSIKAVRQQVAMQQTSSYQPNSDAGSSDAKPADKESDDDDDDNDSNKKVSER